MKFILNKDKLTVSEKETLNSGSIKYYEIPVEADSTWDDVSIEAVIIEKNADKGIATAVINNKVYIDKANYGKYSIGFRGYTVEYSLTSDVALDDSKTYYTHSGSEGSYVYTKVDNPLVGNISSYYEATKTYQISTKLVPVTFRKGAGEVEVENETEIPSISEWEVYIAQIQDMVDDVQSSIPTKYSDLTNDNNTVQDSSYIHTDNNFTDAYKSNVDSNTSARHTHSNKSTLDGISSSDISNWNSKQGAIDSSHKLSSDLIDDTNKTHLFVSASEKATWNNKSNFSGNYNDLSNKPTIPDELKDLSDDSTHRLVTDTEKSTWSGKSVVSGTNDGTNWSTITIDGTTKNIPAGGGGGGGSVDIDNSTITTNSSNKIQTVGMIDSNTGNTDKFWTGTQQEYEAITTKDTNTFYYITDDDTTTPIYYIPQEVPQLTTSSSSSDIIAAFGGSTKYNEFLSIVSEAKHLLVLCAGEDIPTTPDPSRLSEVITVPYTYCNYFGAEGKFLDLCFGNNWYMRIRPANPRLTGVNDESDWQQPYVEGLYNLLDVKLDTSKVKTSYSGTSGDVYASTYINTILEYKQDIIPIETPSQTTISIDANKYYSFGEKASLTITLNTPSDNTIYNEYMFEFDSGTTPTSLTLPNTVSWVETPTIEASKTYQVSIVNNIALIVGV